MRVTVTSKSCIPGQEAEQYLQNGDPQLIRHGMLRLLIIGLSVNLSKRLWWQYNHETG